MKFTYPATRTLDFAEDYHGTLVADPYRWLEDVDSPETQDWIQRQNELTFGWLEQVPGRQRIRKRLTVLWDFPKRSTIRHKGKPYFQFRKHGPAKPGCPLRDEHSREEGHVLLDPNSSQRRRHRRTQ